MRQVSNVTLTEAQAQTLIRLLDIACKAGGLEIAQAALPIAIEIQTQLQGEVVEPND